MFIVDVLMFFNDGFIFCFGLLFFGVGVDVLEENDFFVVIDYIGVFDGDNNWMDGWIVVVNDSIFVDVIMVLE